MKSTISFLLVSGVVAGILWVSMGTQALSSERPRADHEASDTTLVVYYVGATSCGICDRPDVRDAIAGMRAGIERRSVTPAKFVAVAMDRDIASGLDFVAKDDVKWDEISVGAFYRNEVLLSHFNGSVPTPGVPHVIVFEDTYQVDAHGIPTRQRRTLRANVLGGKSIAKWAEKGYPVDG